MWNKFKVILFSLLTFESMKKQILIVIAVLTLTAETCYAQWVEQGCNNNNSNGMVYGVSTPQSGVIWGIMENQNFSPFLTQYIRSTDNGVTWNIGEIDTLPTFLCIKIRALDSLTAFASTLTFPAEDTTRIYRTQDGGATWQFIPSAVNGLNETCIDFHFFDNNRGISYGAKVDGPMTIYSTNDGGDNWSPVPASNLPVPLANEGMLITGGNGTHGAAGANLWFGTTKGRIYHTSDSGYTWSATTVDTTLTIHGVAFKDSLNGVAISSYGLLASTFQPNRSWVTSDGGITWSLSSNSWALPKFGMLKYLPGSANTYISTFGGLGNGGTKISLDGGVTWAIYSNKSIYGADFVSEYDGWGGGRTLSNSQGVFKWTGLSVGTSEYSIPELKITPVPATNMITLNNYKPGGTVKVLNSSGQIIDAQLQGNTINISNLANGLYFVIVSQEDARLVGKFVKH